MIHYLAWLYWNPSRFAFNVPFIDRPIAWYGLLFVTGFLVGYALLIPMFQRMLIAKNQILPRDVNSWPRIINSLRQNPEAGAILGLINPSEREEILELQLHQEPNESVKTAILKALNESLKTQPRENLEQLFKKGLYTTKFLATSLTEKMTWFVVIGTVIGARLGHVFLYEWPRYQNNLLEIFKVWEGGLASHGGGLGVMCALWLYHKSIEKDFPEFSLITIFDMVAVPAPFVCGCIRIGNFINQEIVGPPSNLPWAVIFGRPADGSAPVPRHPTQLYEAIAYFIIFVLLLVLWYRKSDSLRKGMLIGLFLILTFGIRFILEFLKLPMSLMIDESFLQTGQMLSIPFIIAGFYFYFYGDRCKSSQLR